MTGYERHEKKAADRKVWNFSRAKLTNLLDSFTPEARLVIYHKRKQFMYWYIPPTTRVHLDSRQLVAVCFWELRRRVRSTLRDKKKYLLFKEVHELTTAIEERAVYAPDEC